MNEPWEEALDLDDSDLSSLRPYKSQNHRKNTASAATNNISLSQPFLRRCAVPSQSSQPVLSQNPPQSTQTIVSQQPPSNPPRSDISPRLIPGPAGIVQAAMNRRKNHNNENPVGLGEDPIPTQEYIRRAVEGGYPAEDEDFRGEPWLCAVEFIRRGGLGLDSDGAIGIPLSAIKGGGGINLDLNNKVAQVVAIVKSCKPNGLGDLRLTLKDPTATIDASVHRKVLAETDSGKEISVGAVIILRNVAVFSPPRFAHCLNVTVRNVVEVISKDNVAAMYKRHRSASASTNKFGSGLIETTSQGSIEGILNCLRQSAFLENSEGGKNEDHNFVAEKEGLSVRGNVGVGGQPVIFDTEGYVNGEEEDVVAGYEINSGRGNVAEAAADIVDVHSCKESGNVSGFKQQQGSKASLLQWTDEQLDELFAFN